MVFIPRTYVRAAGVQSEIGKMAVNKIAYLQNDYRHMVYMAKMDMKKTMRELKHNREMMRRSMGRYRKKLKEYQVVKQRKYLVELDENPENIGTFNNGRKEDAPTLVLPQINASKNIISQKSVATRLPKNKSQMAYVEKPELAPNEAELQETNFTDSRILLEEENDTEIYHAAHKEDQEITPHSHLNNKDTLKTELRESPGIRKRSEPTSSEISTGNTLGTQRSRDYSETTSVNKSQSVENDPEARIITTSEEKPKILKKRRTGAVNLANIMRLQYSTNLKALFKTVDVLARVHGVNSPVADREITGPRRISKPSETRRISQTSQVATSSNIGENKRAARISLPDKSDERRLSQVSAHRRLSQVSAPRRLSQVSAPRRLSQVSAPRRLSQVSAPRRISQIPAQQGRRRSHASSETLNHILPSDYLYNMKYGYLETEDPRLKEESANGEFSKNPISPSEINPPLNRNPQVDNSLADKRNRKVSRLSAFSSQCSSRRVSTVYNPNSSSHSVDSSESRSRRSILRGDRSMAKVSQCSIQQPYPDDYFERAQPEPDQDVAWRTAFRMLKHVHFIDSSELAA